MHRLILLALIFCPIIYAQSRTIQVEDLIRQVDSVLTIEYAERIKELTSVDTALFIPPKRSKKTVADKILDYLFMETNMIAKDAIVVPEDIENIMKIIEEEYRKKAK